MKFFKNCNCLEDVKKLYHELCMKYHPDISKEENALETMQKINNEYEIAFIKFKDIHKNAQGETYEKTTEETPDEFKNIIEKLIHFENCKIEIIGKWIWVSGNTKPYRETLGKDGLGFKWHNTKQAWSYHNGKFFKKSKKNLSLSEIRDIFGSQEVKTKELLKLAF